ncbi:hypothetical protein [Candidatus Nitrospira allomarina]|uniref:Uncharacterized protein n=1 Tax=Candidatus Nitrospira allomarina TaxID=3020900 RepID=A0AA96GI88_9BACT|nr:hypothetical protein [Candidatus Nitrospira allomarina]WNM59403.1 hypothetical protein PP769_06465 [Candidatus Nitrospira allomarina]
MRPLLGTHGLSVWRYRFNTESAYRARDFPISLSYDTTTNLDLPDVALTGRALHSL